MAIGELARRRVWLLATLAIAGVYLALYLRRGWYPHDEGLLGQTAERVLHGEMPHRDFDEPYTGLLTYLHAAAFQLGGIRLLTLRIPLLVASLFGFAAFFRIASRFVPPFSAAGLTLLALVWSVPNYPASIPSWYNLFLALGMGLALLRWSEEPRSRWLLLAGLLGGLSFLIKLSGLFAVAGGLLFLVYATQQPNGSGRTVGRWSTWVVIGGLLVVVIGLWRSLAPSYHPRFVVHLALPGSLFVLGLAVREWRAGSSGWDRVRSLSRAVLPFLLGVLMPVAGFGIWFATHGALGDLVTDVFVIPFRRLAFASVLPPAPFWILASIPLILLLRPRNDWSSPRWSVAGLVTIGFLAAILVGCAFSTFSYRIVWQSARSLIPVLGAFGGVVLALPRLTARWQQGAEARWVLLGLLLVMGCLIQYPFAAPVYFLYLAPLVILATTALVTAIGRTPAPLGRAGVLFYLGFGAILMNPGALQGLGFRFEGFPRGALLDLPRGGLMIPAEDARTFQQLIRALSASRDSLIWAGPDAPEIYFLSGARNPTRVLFDFLSGFSTDSLPSFVLHRGLDAVVINQRPPFSPPLSDSVSAELRKLLRRRDNVANFELLRR